MDRGRVMANVAASVDQRLRNLARKDHRAIDDVRTRYVLERFLYRLSLSPYRDAYVLKGAVVLQTLAESAYRQTRDVDLHGQLRAEPQDVQGHFRDVLGQDTSAHPDGLRFVQDAIRVTPLRSGVGYRLRLEVRLGPARYPMWVDIAYGDRPTPPPVERTLPSLLGHPGPKLLCYRPETSLAEKFYILEFRGDLNSRMKDFYDIWYVANQLPVSGHDLAAALRAVFDNRNTPLPSVPPVGLTDTFAQDKQPAWTAFREKLQGGERGPEEFPSLVSSIRAFLMPVVKAAETDPDFQGQWDADRGRWVADHLRERDDAVPASREGNAGGAW